MGGQFRRLLPITSANAAEGQFSGFVYLCFQFQIYNIFIIIV